MVTKNTGIHFFYLVASLLKIIYRIKTYMELEYFIEKVLEYSETWYFLEKFWDIIEYKK